MRYEPVQYMPDVIEPGVLYVSDDFGATLHICPCGCGREVHVPIAPFWQGAWRLTVGNSGPTLTPSILNRVCKSHYWVRDGAVQWA